MKVLDIKRIIKVGAFAFGLTVMTVLPTFAQSNAAGNANRVDRIETTRTVERDDTDWSWLGLLGLLGLAGLIPKKRPVEVREVRDTETNRPVSDTGRTS